MSAGSLRERVVEVVAQHPDMTDRSADDGCACGAAAANPREYAAHLADAVLAEVREWLGGAVDSHKGTVAGRLSLADALAALID